MPVPFPTQISGALFLADRPRALLADEPRVGKTGAAIMAADYVMAERLLIITTSSGRPVWRRALKDWSPFARTAQLVDTKNPYYRKNQSAIVSWGAITNPAVRAQLLREKWDAVIPDEAHFGKNFSAKRTQALYGVLTDGGKWLDNNHALAAAQPYIWPLTGTPYPNSQFDIYPMLRALRPHCLAAGNGAPDVTKEQDFLHRYCAVRMKKISAFNRIPVIIGGKNEDELRGRVGDFLLQRTQADVGIREPIYEIMPVLGGARLKRDLDARVSDTLKARLRKGQELEDMEMELAEIRRLTGTAKAAAVAEAVKEEFECGLDKIVIAYWHKDVGAILKDALAPFGVVGIDGATPANIRGEAEQRFLHDPKVRVFLGQIQAAGEAIDLSSAAELIFAETSLTPKDMKQMSLRITNHTQTRQPRVRVAALDGTVDDALQEILLRKWTTIRKVLGQ